MNPIISKEFNQPVPTLSQLNAPITEIHRQIALLEGEAQMCLERQDYDRYMRAVSMLKSISTFLAVGVNGYLEDGQAV